MQLRAWCGHCGESFLLAQFVADGITGRCPRCGRDLAPGYLPVAAAATADVLAATGRLGEALARLRDVAPRLHVDLRQLALDLVRLDATIDTSSVEAAVRASGERSGDAADRTSSGASADPSAHAER